MLLECSINNTHLTNEDKQTHLVILTGIPVSSGLQNRVVVPQEAQLPAGYVE